MDKPVAWMMYSKLLTAWFAAAALLSPAAASKQTPHSTTAVSEEPFRSFRTLDAKLTLLTNQQGALKAASSLTASDSGAAAEQITRRKKASQSMNATAAEIGRLAEALEHLYERRNQSFGVQMFISKAWEYLIAHELLVPSPAEGKRWPLLEPFDINLPLEPS